MRAPSLYTHFESKHAIYDAMFGQAWSDYEQAALTELADRPEAPERRFAGPRACSSTSRSPNPRATSS